MPQFDELNRLWLARHQQTWYLWSLPSNATTVLHPGAGTIVYQPGLIADAGLLVQQYLGGLGTFPMTPPNLAQYPRAKVWTDDTNEIVHLLSYDVVLGPSPSRRRPTRTRTCSSACRGRPRASRTARCCSPPTAPAS